MLHAISIHTSDLIDEESINKIISTPVKKIDTNLDDIYQDEIKTLYSKIIEFALISQQNMNKEQNEYITELKLASNLIVKILKDTRDIQKNMDFYVNSKNEDIKKEYLQIKKELATYILNINNIKKEHRDDEKVAKQLERFKGRLYKLDLISNGRIDELIRKERITSKMATSLINDSSSTHNICKNLLRIANILFVKNKILRELSEKEEETQTSQG